MTDADFDRETPGSSGPDGHAHHADVGNAPPVRPTSTRRMVIIGAVVVVALATLYVMALLPRRAVSQQLAAEAAADTLPSAVRVSTVHRTSTGGAVALPGTIEALHEGAIYARVAGYVKKWYVDIGSVVHAGDVLAELDAPELMQNVEQARQQLAQVKASLNLARTDLTRWKELANDSAVTREELDQKQAAYDVAFANEGAAEANLQRLVDLEGYTRVRAPFSGVVTARSVDIGSLITAAGATSSAVAGGDAAGTQAAGSLFRIAQTDTVRMYIPVPESYAASMTVGLPAYVTVQEIHDRTFTGHIARTSHALDAGSRTLLTEVDIGNPGFALIPGMYAQVQMQFPTAASSLVVPATALVIRADGPQLMEVDTAGGKATIHLHQVQVGRDYGTTIEILGGIAEGARVITNPTTDMADGTHVQVVATPAQAPANR